MVPWMKGIASTSTKPQQTLTKHKPCPQFLLCTVCPFSSVVCLSGWLITDNMETRELLPDAQLGKLSVWVKVGWDEGCMHGTCVACQTHWYHERSDWDSGQCCLIREYVFESKSLCFNILFRFKRFLIQRQIQALVGHDCPSTYVCYKTPNWDKHHFSDIIWVSLHLQ